LGQTSTLNEAVLDWQPEHEGQRERSHQAAYNILALLSIFLSRKQAFHIIADVIFFFLSFIFIKIKYNIYIYISSLMNKLFVFHLNIFKHGLIMDYH